MEIISSRIVEDKIKSSSTDTLNYSDAIIARYENSLSEIGKWDDIDYKSEEPAVWEPIKHLQRLTAMSLGIINNQSIYYRNGSLKDKVLIGLKYWIECNPSSSNWWWGIISEPQILGLLMNILKYANIVLDDDIKQRLLNRLPDSDPFEYKGANRSDVGIARLYKSLYIENSQGVKEGLNAIFSAIEICDNEVFQEDGSYFKGGPQLYISGYSEVLIENTLSFAEYVCDTEFEINQEKKSIISNFVRGVYSASIRGQVMAFNCNGRNVSRPDKLNKESSVRWIKKLEIIDKDNAEDYKSLIKRLTKEVTSDYNIYSFARHYYKGDYTIQQTPKYNIAIRTLSSRTLRDEMINGENLKGYYICDGSTNIARTGKEYYNIMPLWNWHYIPGTTVPNTNEIPQIHSIQTGNSKFCGGVTDSLNAVVTLKYFDSYNDINTGGNKGYFIFKNEMVCLGSDIHSDKDCHTTINQVWYNEKGYEYKNQNNCFKEGLREDTIFTSSICLIHDSIGYYIPTDQSVKLSIENRMGTWYDINNGFGTKEEVKGKIFQLVLDHVENNFYQYIVVPNITKEGMEDYINNCPISILENTERIQAVYHKHQNTYGVIFYEGGQIELEGFTLHVSSPCAVLINALCNGEYSLYISDPSQNLNSTAIDLLFNDGEIINLSIDFPIQRRGSSLKYFIQTNKNSIMKIDDEQENNTCTKYYYLDGRHSNIIKKNIPMIEIKGNNRRIIIKK